MERVAKLIDEELLTVWLLVCKPDSDWLEFHGKDSDMYKTVTTWCDLEKDLKQIKIVHQLDPELDSVILQTHNGIVYDKSKDAFAYLSDVFNEETPKLSIRLPEEIEEDLKYDVTLIYEADFTNAEWNDLISMGITSRIFELESKYIV